MRSREAGLSGQGSWAIGHVGLYTPVIIAFYLFAVTGLPFVGQALAEAHGWNASFVGTLFDVLIIAIDDLFYLPGPILSHASPVHAASALTAIVMTGAVIAGLVYRPKSRVFSTVGWTSIFLLVAYVLNSYLLFLRGA